MRCNKFWGIAPADAGLCGCRPTDIGSVAPVAPSIVAVLPVAVTTSVVAGCCADST
eukprot:CAMPEP_0115534320 /NCGR_PEP_ID=MMETSP0271-20121206/86610_1 /TAXON_ID=71861 /ORGANISM="Scrippsiella trochoidea, Strain CCMP3099" /LENGTH=55 /DNA_ID=CAMNT_0002966797 /DNA_START=1 /DNA_END=164 /DNA_ORIENTATION=-